MALKSDALAGFVDKRKGTGKKAMKVIKTVVPKAKAAPKANTKKDSSKVFDKAWFKSGPPKHYGPVTVFIDRPNRRYRGKPEPGSRYEWSICWGNTEEEQQVQWGKIVDRVREYQKRT